MSASGGSAPRQYDGDHSGPNAEKTGANPACRAVASCHCFLPGQVTGWLPLVFPHCEGAVGAGLDP
jgi:hypothetical protein